jgi:hypothetical protein
MKHHRPTDQTHERPPKSGPLARAAAALALRRTGGYKWTMTACVAVAGFAGLAVLANTATSAKSTSQHHGAPPTKNIAFAHLKRQVLAAAKDEGNFISASTSTLVPNGTSAAPPGLPAQQGALVPYTNRSWFDPVTGAQRTEHITAHGIESEQAETLTRTPRLRDYHFTQLYYPTRVWYSYTKREPGSASPSSTRSLAQVLLNRTHCPYSVTGQATIAGQRTLVMAPANTTPGVYCDFPTIWVNARTYQLVQTVANGVQGTTTIDQQWLPRTPANIALTQIHVPAGFAQSPTPPPFDPSAY